MAFNMPYVRIRQGYKEVQDKCKIILEKIKKWKEGFFFIMGMRFGPLIKVNKSSIRAAVQAHFGCHLKLPSPGIEQSLAGK